MIDSKIYLIKVACLICIIVGSKPAVGDEACTQDDVDLLMAKQKDGKAYSVSFNPNGMASGSILKHSPYVYENQEHQAIVNVPHVMNADHSITHVWLGGSTDEFISCRKLTPDDATSDNKVKLTMDLSTSLHVTPYAACDKHGIWKGNDYDRLNNYQLANKKYKKDSEGPFHAGNHPEGWAGKQKSHIPVVEVSGDRVTVKLTHGISFNHWITAIWVKDEADKVIKHIFLPHTRKPEITFQRPSKATTLRVFANCNTHGVWQSEPLVLSASATHEEL